MPAQNLTPKMVRQGIQHYAVGKDQATASRTRNDEDNVEVDRMHTELVVIWGSIIRCKVYAFVSCNVN